MQVTEPLGGRQTSVPCSAPAGPGPSGRARNARSTNANRMLPPLSRKSGPKQVPGRAGVQDGYLILPSRYSTCLRATGSYFLTFILSVIVREFFRVT